MNLNIDVKYTPSEAAICLIISKHYLCKMEIYCVASISHAKSIICQRKGRNTRIHVQFIIVCSKLRCIRPFIVVYTAAIKEVTSVAKCPVWSGTTKSCLSSFLWIIIICNVSIRSYELPTTIYMERVQSWDNKKWVKSIKGIKHNKKLTLEKDIRSWEWQIGRWLVINYSQQLEKYWIVLLDLHSFIILKGGKKREKKPCVWVPCTLSDMKHSLEADV